MLSPKMSHSSTSRFLSLLCHNQISLNPLLMMFFSLIAVKGVNVFKGCNCRECIVMFQDYTSSCWPALCSPCSLGVVLSRGHGEYILLGNTSVEEGRLIWNGPTVLTDKVATLKCTTLLLLHSLYLSVCHLIEFWVCYLVSGLHDLLQPDVSLANEW